MRRAIYRPTSKVVAIKVFPPDVLAKKSGQALWDSEMKFHCPLKHDNVLQCYDFFIEDDYGYCGIPRRLR
jgi:serine/threonine protein kinase